MNEFVSKEEIRNARKADIFGFLLSNHPNKVRKLGHFLQLKDYDSVMLQNGYAGFFRNSTGESGNPIDLLVRYFGYSFTDAVKALNGHVLINDHIDSDDPVGLQPKYIGRTLPASAEPPYKRVYAYLTNTRGISGDTVNALISARLIYQDIMGNVVFVNRPRNYCEIRGTYSNVKFHQIIKTDDSAPLWWFKVGKGAPVLFICESSIDAISLYELKRLKGTLNPGSVFCSVGGAGKQTTISRLEKQKPRCLVLAVDNDDAGEECRHRNPGLPFLLPSLKDWNEDLRRHKAGKST